MLYAVSRIPTNNTPLSVYSTHTLYQTKHPSHLEHNLEAGSPLAGLPQNPTPGQHRAVGHTRTHPYRIYRAPVRLWRGCSAVLLSSSLVFVSRLALVSLPRDEVLSRRDEVLSRWRLRFISSRAKQRKSESLSASLVSSRSLSSCVCPLLSSLKRETGRALPRFVWLSVIQLRGPD